MSSITNLLTAIHHLAQEFEFPIDYPVYKAAAKDPTYPILYAGNLQSQLCFFGRDLGRDEVFASQPLYGAAGTLVRQGFYWAMHKQQTDDKEKLASICTRVLLTNTVPYKPPGNKAYSQSIKETFRPFIEQLLVFHWQGNQIISLGTEAFKWFIPYGNKGEVNSFFQQSDRFEQQLSVILIATDELGMKHKKQVTLLPLPHPSPLNQKYYAQFPQMLQSRLQQCEF